MTNEKFHVLVPLDGSPEAETALRAAMPLVWGFSAKVSLLNVLEYEDNIEAYLKFCLEHNAHYRYARRLMEIDPNGRSSQGAEFPIHYRPTTSDFDKPRDLEIHRRQPAMPAVPHRGLSQSGRVAAAASTSFSSNV